ncbi:sodium-dependent bicarbonate transport family permease [Gracilimonas sp.]|uniref:sodium-dependent bicarbonate transport family permease n=1 Tax=Gracilimonas sp. TaxID=1974203 RepID=UPI002871F775|nr:sodium-dependent bicarbonate transport family permease [Gracilimonas sp.]
METLLTNFTSPIVLAFVLGIVAKLVKSDLEFPRPIYQALSIYLLLAIGLKGGVELSTTPFSEFVWPAVATLFLGILTPLIAYTVLRHLGKLDIDNSAGIAAHYGSVSAVTFIASISYVETLGLSSEGFMPTLVALLEVPGIIVALMIPQLSNSESGSLKKAFHEVITGSSIVLLLGGLVIGFIAGPLKFESVKPFFVSGFQGALVLFLLELGMITARRLEDLKKVGFFLLGFGIVVPIIHGVLAIVIGLWAGLSVAGASVFAAMVSSGSYIAAPAAVRIALPKASPTLYLTASLGITFPFNIALGIPLYYIIAAWFGG